MGENVFLPLMLIAIVGLIIVLPFFFQSKVQQKQLDTVAKAIEKGIDPELIKSSLSERERKGDVNGNWKAGIILIGISMGVFLLSCITSIMNGDFSPEILGTLLPAIPGLVLIYIHKSIIGDVVKR